MANSTQQRSGKQKIGNIQLSAHPVKFTQENIQRRLMLPERCLLPFLLQQKAGVF